MSATFFYSAKPVLVNVGGQKNSGFRAVATCIIDQQLAHNNQDHSLLNTLLETMYLYYPRETIPPRGNLNSEERLDFFKRSLSLPVLVEQLAYTLQQIALLEILNNPTKYRKKYLQLHENTSLNAEINHEIRLDKPTIEALEAVLDMQVVIFEVGEGKEAHSKVPSKSSGKFSISLQLDIDTQHYVAKVHNPSWFRTLAHSTQRAPKPRLLENPIPPNKESVLRLWDEEDKKQAHEYLEAKNLLSRISTKEVLDLYIKKIPSNDYPRNRLTTSNTFIPKNQNKVTKTHDENIAETLIHTLAHAKSTGHITLDELMDISPAITYKKP